MSKAKKLSKKQSPTTAGAGAAAEKEKIEASHLVLSCIDHRCTDDVAHLAPMIILHGDDQRLARKERRAPRETFTDEELRRAAERYDHLALPGASLGVVQAAFPAWSEAFWQQLGLALVLHPGIRTLVVLDHMDCGAYKRLLVIDNDADEERAHRRLTEEFARQVKARHPGLEVERWLLEPHPAGQQHTWCAYDLDHDALHEAMSCVHEGS